MELMRSELQRRLRDNPIAKDFFDGSFDAQTNFVKSHKENRLNAALCTRRAAKSYSCGIHFFEDSKKFKGENYVFIALTRDSTRKIFWKAVLKAIDKKFKIGCKFNESRLECTTPWGSTITLVGMDDSEDEREKLLGQKLRWAYIDESASFTVDIEDLVYIILLPAVADLNGGITMIGTPSNNTKCFFYKVTTGKENGWNVHKWSYKDNPYTANEVQSVIDILCRAKEGYETTPRFKQMYLGEWEVDLSSLVYKFSRERNLNIKGRSKKIGDTIILGVDLGFDDESSFTICAYNNLDKKLHVLKSYGKSGLDITAVAQEIKKLIPKFDPSAIIVDGANKQAVQEIINRHDIPLIPAQKERKFEFIQIMNADFISGSIQIVNDECLELIEELESLIWDEKRLPKRVELASLPNHKCDSLLYAWRYSYNYIINEVKNDKTDEEKVNDWWEQQVLNDQRAIGDHAQAEDTIY